MKPKASAIGFVDGGWWPLSWDLAAELPELLQVLAVRLGRIEGVSYHLGEWGPTPHKISIDHGVVRLEGFRAQRVNTIDVHAERERVTLLVVPPELPAQDAHAALMAAGQRGNTDDAESLLASRRFTPRVVARPPGDAAAEADEQRWEVDGGHLYPNPERSRSAHARPSAR